MTQSPLAPLSEASQASSAMLKVHDLAVHFKQKSSFALWQKSSPLRAVDGVSLEIHENETLGLVGESGCGKSTLARAIARLLTPTRGTIHFEGKDISTCPEHQLGDVRAHIQMVFQDPSSSLNPRMTIEQIIAEPMAIANWDKQRISARTAELLDLVGLNHTHLQRYPHEFSGGQKQRIVITRALALHPKLVVCDEPVSALDVSVQAQIINLLKDIQERLGVSYLFVAHDLGVVRQISQRVMVMYLGEIVESALKSDLYAHPLHPYSQALLSAIPRPKPGLASQRIILRGELPSASNPPSGCRFHQRCPKARAECAEQKPLLREVAKGRYVACHFVES